MQHALSTRADKAQSSLPVALVTGAGRGIGLATSSWLLRHAFRVVMVDRADVEPAGDRRTDCAESKMSAAIDVTDIAAMTALRQEVHERWGPVRVLVNNAGISPKQQNGRASTLATMEDAEWNAVLAVNLTAVMRICRLFLPDMEAARHGRIINVASLAGRTRSRVAGPAYVASKTGVIGLTRAIAGEYGHLGITANCVAPGRILSDMSGAADSTVNQAYLTQIPAGRLGTVDEVAAAIGYLASDAAGFVNGAVIDINGGAHMA